jgi:hypothetical protein
MTYEKEGDMQELARAVVTADPCEGTACSYCEHGRHGWSTLGWLGHGRGTWQNIISGSRLHGAA